MSEQFEPKPHAASAKTLTAVLFAGGLSRRMGADKATLQIGGEPLWARQLHLLRELESQAVCISARERPVWCPAEIEIIVDEPPSRGPLSGLAAALRRLQTSHLLALAIDLPRMRLEQIQKLWSRAEPGCGVVPVIEERYEPLSAIYPAEAATTAENALRSNDFSLQPFIQSLCRENRMRVVPVDDSERILYRNLNTPEDIHKLAAEQS